MLTLAVLSKACHTIKRLFIFLGASLMLIQCGGPKFPSDDIVPKPTKFIFSGYLNNCFKTANGTDAIDFDISIIIWRYDNNAGKIQYNTGTIQSPATAIKQPVEITLDVPSNKMYTIEAQIVGKDCSRCASGFGGDPNPSWRCVEIQTADGYSVARPRQLGGFNVYSYVTVANVTHWTQIPNEPNTCGCIVPF